jgi:small multidrug resistance pump
MSYSSFFWIVIYAVLSSLGILLIKVSAFDVSKIKFVSAGSLLTAIAGLVLYLGSFLIWLWIIRISQVSIAFPVAVSFASALIAVLSWAFLKESFEVKNLLALVVIGAGIYLLTS